jgi:light-regulated signal transduction histidine kinase (bacteriophytochrome)
MQTTADTRPRSSAEEREELAHAISHDFAQPLTTISGFARLLVSRYEYELDEDAREQLTSIAERAADMQEMIDEVVGSLRHPVAAPSRQTVAV